MVQFCELPIAAGSEQWGAGGRAPTSAVLHP